MKAVILAGGLGTRLKPFTEVIPKPLLPIGEKAVLEIQIEHLRKHGVTEVFLATNYKSAYIENFFGDGSRYGVNLVISREEKRLGTAGPLKLLEKQLDEPFVVMNGDILCNVDFSALRDYAAARESLLTITVKKIVMPYAFGNIFFDGDRVTGIEEKPNLVTHALAGIYVMKPGIFAHIPEDEYYGMDQLILKLLAEGQLVTKYDLKDYWLDIGRVDDYESAQEDFQKNFYATETTAD
ncbi:MAG: sugar phosphate nucleotidyltransferase [Verrucomicrobia bacterium]|nr:sugar phosphate nucleotidyltransferase [Verrucomicrobiota bacterium]